MPFPRKSRSGAPGAFNFCLPATARFEEFLFFGSGFPSRVYACAYACVSLFTFSLIFSIFDSAMEKSDSKKPEDRLVLVCFMGFLYPVKKADLKAFRAFLKDQEK